jgi:RNA polymerase sigma factor (TIGR02999 family)
MIRPTLLLNAGSEGHASSDLLPPVYQELRRVAAQKMAGEAADHTLGATALVHEAWLRLGVGDRKWENRAHFFAAAADTMRRVLVDHARRRKAQRRGGGWNRVDAVEAEEAASPSCDEQILAVHEALEDLTAEHPDKARLVKLRFFGGLTSEEAAEVLGISAPTATRHWAFARAWLMRRINTG